MVTTAQQRAIGRGMAATVERSKQQNTMTLQVTWEGVLSPASLIAAIERALPSRIGTPVKVDRIWDGEAERNRAELKQYQQETEQLRLQVRDLMTRLEMQPTAASSHDTAISLADWAISLGISYSTAWRHKAAGRVEFKKVGGGKKHDTVLVYPETFRPPTPKSKRR